MSVIDSDKKFTIHPSTLDMTERRSALNNSTGEVITIQDLIDTVGAGYVSTTLTQDEVFAIKGATDLGPGNPVATMADIAYKTGRYKAQLTQTATDNPVARVLNQIDVDYLGVQSFKYSAIGKYIIEDFFLYYNISLIDVVISGVKAGTTADWQNTRDNLVINTYDATGALADDLLENTTIDIAVRLRGEPPVFLSAETNEAGDEIILAFDKLMNGYLFDSIEDSFTDGALAHTFTVTSSGVEITLAPDTGYALGDVIALTYDASIALEAFDLGLAAAFTDEPVTNNIPYLMSAETNVEGTKIICTFNRPMGNVTTPTNVVVNKDGGGTAEFDTINLGATPFTTFEINMTEVMTSGDVFIITIGGTGVPTAEGTAVLESTGVVVVNNVPE